MFSVVENGWGYGSLTTHFSLLATIMRVELVVIGDEILAGRTVDTNSNYIAQGLLKLGLTPSMITVVPDAYSELAKALRNIISRADIIITIGGLGPTPDDKTRESLAEALSRPLEENTEAACMLMNYKVKNSVGYNKQVSMPEGSIALHNLVGIAPGIYIKTPEEKRIFSLPGVPNEMKAMFDNEVSRILEHEIKTTPSSVYLLRTTGICEIDLLKRLSDYPANLKEKIAFYPSYEGVDIRIVGDKEIYKKCKGLFSPYVYTEKELLLSEIVGNLLREKRATLSCAESCSGGFLSSRIVDIPGASDYYLGGVVSYSNEAKMKTLGVDKELLEHYGAVSGEVAKNMAEGAKANFGSNYALSTTGIAGPTGGTQEKPIGLVFIALARPNKPTYIRRYRFNGTREMVRRKTVQAALFLLFLELKARLENFPFVDGSEEIVL